MSLTISVIAVILALYNKAKVDRLERRLDEIEEDLMFTWHWKERD